MTAAVMQVTGGGGEASSSRPILQHLNLLRGSNAAVREPLTQPPPVMTQDMLAEKEAALSALGKLPVPSFQRMTMLKRRTPTPPSLDGHQ